MSRHTPWAVLLCKFADDRRGFVTLDKQKIADMFTRTDIESIATFWQDVSYGELDLSGSRAFGWLSLTQKQQDYQDALNTLPQPEARGKLVTWAKKAASDAGVKLDPFYGVAIYMSTKTDLWGGKHTVVCDLESSPAQILQEYGHGYGLIHSRAVADPRDYRDPFCVMSSDTFGDTNPTFDHERFGRFGPLLCSPYVEKAGWLAPERIVSIETNGKRPAMRTIELFPLGGKTERPEVVTFDLTDPFEVTYFIEFRSGGWDRGLTQSQVVVHQRREDGYAYYAGNIPASTWFGATTLLPGKSWVDPQFDLSVTLNKLPVQDGSVTITVGPAAVAQALSVRTIARNQLNLTGPLSVRAQVLQPGMQSLTASLIALSSR
jgi:hypothetical protein